jgi:hypothetical protein
MWIVHAQKKKKEREREKQGELGRENKLVRMCEGVVLCHALRSIVRLFFFLNLGSV